MRTSSANVSESSKETRGNVSSELLLDAWPILEWLKNREPAATLFQEIVEDTLASRRTLTMSRISYADAFAAALALRRNVSFVTGNREFRPLLNIGLKLHWVGA